MTGNDIKNIMVSAAFVVPTSSLDGWKELQFNKIPKNTVSVVNHNSLKVEVKDSASPLIYKLPDVVTTKSVEFTYDLVSQEALNFSKGKSSTFPEDFILRIGLVAKGEKLLGWLQKKIAAQWVLELFSLAPKDVGLDKIYFHNIALSQQQVGSYRVHPKSDLMNEEIIGSFPENKKVNHILKKPIDVVAIWISIDGDDTKSSFVTEINELKLIQ